MDEKKTPHNSKRLLVFFVALILITAAVFLGNPMRLPEQTVICGIDMSDMTLSSAEAMLAEAVRNYSVKVTVVCKVIIFMIKSRRLLNNFLVLITEVFRVKLVAECTPESNSCFCFKSCTV